MGMANDDADAITVGWVRAVLWAHGIVTAAAAALLLIAPVAFPGMLGLRVDDTGVLLAYLLAGAEAGIAAVSMFAARSRDARTVQALIGCLAVFHLVSIVGSVLWMLAHGPSPVLVANAVFRAVVIIVFARGVRAVRRGEGAGRAQ